MIGVSSPAVSSTSRSAKRRRDGADQVFQASGSPPPREGEGDAPPDAGGDARLGRRRARRLGDAAGGGRGREPIGHHRALAWRVGPGENSGGNRLAGLRPTTTLHLSGRGQRQQTVGARSSLRRVMTVQRVCRKACAVLLGDAFCAAPRVTSSVAAVDGVAELRGRRRVARALHAFAPARDELPGDGEEARGDRCAPEPPGRK